MATTVEWDDKEIKTPEHDRLVLYLMSNPESLISKKPSGSELIEKQTLTEVPVKSGTFIVGYLDLKITFVLQKTVSHKHSESVYDYGCHVRCKSWCDTPCELVCVKETDTDTKHTTVAVEVKPKVDNFGSLVRQINKYKQYIKEIDYWVVYTEDCPKEIEEALKTQGVTVVIHKPV